MKLLTSSIKWNFGDGEGRGLEKEEGRRTRRAGGGGGQEEDWRRGGGEEGRCEFLVINEIMPEYIHFDFIMPDNEVLCVRLCNHFECSLTNDNDNDNNSIKKQ